jgi:hypothetical protein
MDLKITAMPRLATPSGRHPLASHATRPASLDVERMCYYQVANAT